MTAYIRFADPLSAWFGKAFAWLIMLMTLGTSYEVVVRYLFNAPTPWAFDVSYIMYGTLFMMARRLHAVARRARARRLHLPAAGRRAGRRASTSCSTSSSSSPACWRSSSPAGSTPPAPGATARSASTSPAGMPIYPAQVGHRRRRPPALHPGHRPGLPLHPLHARPATGCRPSEDVRETDEILIEAAQHGEDAAEDDRVTDPQVALLMLALFILAIFLGFPIAFTLMAMGVIFGYYAYFDAGPDVAELQPARRDRLDLGPVVALGRGVLQQPHLRPLHQPDLHGHVERRADGDPAVPVHGLHRRARQHRRPAVHHARHRREGRPRLARRSPRSSPARSSPPPPASSARWSR